MNLQTLLNYLTEHEIKPENCDIVKKIIIGGDPETPHVIHHEALPLKDVEVEMGRVKLSFIIEME